MAATCSNCGTWTAFSSIPENLNPHKLESSNQHFPDFTQTDYIEFAQALDIQRSSHVIVITEHPSRKTLTNFVSAMSVVSVLGISLGALSLYFAFIDPTFPFIFSIIGLIIGTVAGFSPLNHYLNSNVIMIDKEDVYFSARPYPTLNGVGAKERIAGYQQFYVTRKSGGAKNYALFGIDFENKRREIISGDEKFVLLLESEIEKFLKIEDRPVGGALSNPYQSSR